VPALSGKEKTMSQYTEDQIETIARAVHETNRAWCIAHDDYSQLPWEELVDEAGLKLRESATIGVLGVIAGNGPRESHQSWLDTKAAQGWTWGPVKDTVAQRHPCFVPYDELPPEQQAKDHIFVGVVRSFMAAFDALPKT